MSIRERALVEESWCIVKHLLCAEEHTIETVQKLMRMREENKELDPIINELLELGDTIRLIRQRIVDITLRFEKHEEKENRRPMHNM